MSVDPDVLAALSETLEGLTGGAQGPIPVAALTTLAPLAQPGMRLKIDLDASAVIGAPLVTLTQAPQNDALLAPLTARQRQVAGLLIEGKSNKEISKALNITVPTVKDHVHAILQALGLPSRRAVMAAAHASLSG